MDGCTPRPPKKSTMFFYSKCEKYFFLHTMPVYYLDSETLFYYLS